MYKKAAKLGLRFESKVGLVNVEDLFNLPLISNTKVSLDAIAKEVNKQLKAAEEESFVTEASANSTILQLKLDILKDIIKDRKEANRAAKERADNKAKKERILEIIASKQDANLLDKSEEELIKMAESL